MALELSLNSGSILGAGNGTVARGLRCYPEAGKTGEEFILPSRFTLSLSRPTRLSSISLPRSQYYVLCLPAPTPVPLRRGEGSWPAKCRDLFTRPQKSYLWPMQEWPHSAVGVKQNEPIVTDPTRFPCPRPPLPPSLALRLDSVPRANDHVGSSSVK